MEDDSLSQYVRRCDTFRRFEAADRSIRGQILTTRIDQGWEWNGVVYGSLTAVAKAATGSHRSGRAFFGLTRPKERRA